LATRTQRISVGIFVIIGGLLIVGGLLYLTGFTQASTTNYWMEFEESILGLNVGANVEYLGVPVGQVTNIRVTDRNTARVDVTVNDDKVTLYQGVTAQTTLYSIATGVLIVSLQGGDSSKPKLPPGYEIPTKESLTSELLSGVSNLQEDFGIIVQRLREGLAGMEDGDLTRIVQNVEEITEQLIETMDRVDAVAAEAEDAIPQLREDLDEAMAKFNELADNLVETSDQASELIATAQEKVEPVDFEATNRKLQNVLDNANALAEKLSATTESVDEALSTTTYDVENLEYTLNDLANSAMSAIESIEALADELRQNPASIVRGRGTPKGAQ